MPRHAPQQSRRENGHEGAGGEHLAMGEIDQPQGRRRPSCSQGRSTRRSTQPAKSDFDSLVGHVAFQPDGELKQPFIFLYTVKNGKFELLK